MLSPEVILIYVRKTKAIIKILFLLKNLFKMCLTNSDVTFRVITVEVKTKKLGHTVPYISCDSARCGCSSQSSFGEELALHYANARY